MKYALIDNNKQEATKGARGICPVCNEAVIAKCGPRKINHWSHKSNSDCDLWWENETPWHREWKNNFFKEWQEVVHHDDSNEKHIADVKTNEDWIIEFQHSYINPEERKARNDFYGKIIWVVDGLRLKNSLEQFRQVADGSILIKDLQIQQANDAGKSTLIKDWHNSNAPVFFDFRGSHLHLLFPNRTSKKVYLSSLPKEMFINKLKNKEFDYFYKNIIETRIEIIPELEEVQEHNIKIIQKQQGNTAMNQLLCRKQYTSRRRRRF